MPKQVVATCLLLSVLLGSESKCSARVGERPLIDKTLVAWVRANNIPQEHGSVLTLIDKAERFDAVVLGEVARGKWMAGSDFHRRTAKDQAAWPVETADAKTLVQIAVVYQGRQVTIYRDGKKYASHAIAEPQLFGQDAFVMIGLRYLGKMGEVGFFNGRIDDVRIYDVPLTAQQIAALIPNKPSEVRPLAWWNFEDGTTADLMKNFDEIRLFDASVADGELRLNGNGYMLAARDKKSLPWDVDPDESLKGQVQTVFYKSQSKRTGNMWDTWLFLHQGTYYQYTLGKAGTGCWDNVSMARSPDGVHWTEIGRVLARSRGPWTGTGSTWKSPNFDQDRTFIINYSECPGGGRQMIYFAKSKDLVHWTRLGHQYEFAQDERWYEREGRWDCIWTLPRPGGGLYGFWTATPKKETGGRFGFGESLDGVTWKALPPPKVEGMGEGEVGAIEKIGDKYYMMFGSYPTMYTIVADAPQGPFRRAAKNAVLLSGGTYFTRFVRMPDALLVNHHAIARDEQVSFAPLKLAALDSEGTLRLAWWKGNEGMKHQRVAVKKPALADGAPAMVEGRLDVRSGAILEGKMVLPAAKSPRRGLFVECEKGQGGAVLFDSDGIAQIGTMKPDGSDFKAEKTAKRDMTFTSPATFRLLLKGSLMEIYLNDILVECYSLPSTATGRIGLIQGEGAAFEDLVAWR